MAAPAGTDTEAIAWVVTADSTGVSIGAAVAGSVTRASGPPRDFALAGVAGALAVLIVAVREPCERSSKPAVAGASPQPSNSLHVA